MHAMPLLWGNGLCFRLAQPLFGRMDTVHSPIGCMLAKPCDHFAEWRLKKSPVKNCTQGRLPLAVCRNFRQFARILQQGLLPDINLLILGRFSNAVCF